MCQAAPGRFALGIGTSSNVIVERWNGMTFDKPYQRVRDTIRFLRAALAGEKVTENYETFAVNGFRLGIPVPEQPPILVAALREGMLRLAGREGDGAIVNWLSADDVKTVAPHVGADKEIVARIFVLPSTTREWCARSASARSRRTSPCPCTRRSTNGSAAATSSPTCGDSGRKATARPPPSRSPTTSSTSCSCGASPKQCREHIQRYIDNGVTTPAPALFCGPGQLPDVLDALKPSAGSRASLQRPLRGAIFELERLRGGRCARRRNDELAHDAPARDRSRRAQREPADVGAAWWLLCRPSPPVTSASDCPFVAEFS